MSNLLFLAHVAAAQSRTMLQINFKAISVTEKENKSSHDQRVYLRMFLSLV